MEAKKPDSFFSIAFELILVNEEIPYDLYVNSSSKKDKEKFVRIFPRGGTLSTEDLERFEDKYLRLYIPEPQRKAYLKSLVRNDNADDVTKTEVIKDSAVHYLDNLFDTEKAFNTEILTDAIEGCRESVESMVDVIRDKSITDLRDLIGDLSFHDFYTYDHSINVSMYNISILKALKPDATKEEMILAGLGGLLHDLGKVRIPTEIINNPGKLTEDEIGEIKKHPGYGGELIDAQVMSNSFDSSDVDYNLIKRVIMEHHENWDGSGYPKKLKGKNIHLLSRITCISDFFDAVTTKRSYHDAIPVDEAIAIMERAAGKKIDPNIFNVFVEKVNKIAVRRKSNVELPDDFDGGQPYNVLPFQKVQPKKQPGNIFAKDEKQDYGKIKTQSDGPKKVGDKKKLVS